MLCYAWNGQRSLQMCINYRILSSTECMLGAPSPYRCPPPPLTFLLFTWLFLHPKRMPRSGELESKVKDSGHWLIISYIDTKAKCPLKGLCGRCFICLRPRLLLQNMVSDRTQHSPPTPSHTLSVFTVRWHREGWESWTIEKVRGATGHKAGLKLPTWLNVSPVYKLW